MLFTSQRSEYCCHVQKRSHTKLKKKKFAFGDVGHDVVDGVLLFVNISLIDFQLCEIKIDERRLCVLDQ